MDAGSVRVGSSRLRRHLADFLGGIRHWAANEKAHCNLPAEIAIALAP